MSHQRVCQADEMLSRGFKDQIYDIFKSLPPSVQAPKAAICAASWPANEDPGILYLFFEIWG